MWCSGEEEEDLFVFSDTIVRCFHYVCSVSTTSCSEEPKSVLLSIRLFSLRPFCSPRAQCPAVDLPFICARV